MSSNGPCNCDQSIALTEALARLVGEAEAAVGCLGTYVSTVEEETSDDEENKDAAEEAILRLKTAIDRSKLVLLHWEESSWTGEE